MTYKFVGILRSLTDDKPYQRTAIIAGIAVGAVIAVLRKLLKPRSFIVDAVLLPSPYALSFGGFVNLPTLLWFAGGSVVGELLGRRADGRTGLPPDMSAVSLVGGGLIAGDALAALGIGVVGLLAMV
jgi:hypothetical protein